MKLIKKAEKDDLIKISAMDVSIAESNKNSAILIADSTQAWRSWIDNGMVFKAVDSTNKLVGVIVALSANNRGYYIHKLLISDENSNAEVSSQLIERFLIEVDKRENDVYVIVRPKDLDLINLYSALGFKKQIFQRNYLGENEDRLIMTRPIKWSDASKSNKVLSLNKNPDVVKPVRLHKERSNSKLDGNLFLKSMNFNNYSVR